MQAHSSNTTPPGPGLAAGCYSAHLGHGRARSPSPTATDTYAQVLPLPPGGASSSFPDAAAWGRRALRKKLDLRAELGSLSPWEQTTSYSSPSPHEAAQGKPQ